ncbi:DNA repair protein RecN [Candidatus Lariskella endosymbiont of Hedychridium roseum]|uniref:DNA repair protein RecN n=1 Tax=Candidatus Lariskella endosymbiont of Hedychridium roseum TaxID=3077949 RepID=UPI0030D5BC25
MVLRLLTVENFVLIENISIEFDLGLCILSGETGAGKSIILDALGLALGDKGGVHFLKDKNKAAVVTVEIEVDLLDNKNLRDILLELGIEAKPLSTACELIIRRVINPDGRTRAFLNNSLINIGQLGQICSHLVEVCGQHKNQQLLDPREYINILDLFSKNEKILKDVEAYFDTMQNIKKQLNNAIATQAASESEKAYLKHVIDEIEAFMPIVGEEALLDEKRKVLISKTKILEATLESTSILDMPGTGVISQLCAIEKALSRFPDYFSDVNLKFEAIRIDLQELSNTVEHKRSELIINEDLDFIENRLFELRNLIRKYRVTDNDLNKFLEYAKKQYEMICDIGSIIERLSKELQDAQGNYLREAKLLSERRKTAAFELRSKILAEFQHINLEKADILVQVDELDIQEAKKNGINNVTFLIKTNSNSEFGALSKIASGGELSRFMLAYKVALSGNKGVTSIIFDEIDSGIGGKVASNVGKKLLKLSEEKQVIVVTHQPQVVVYANNHYLVEKEQTNEAAKVTVNKLSKLDSISEVARMLSGSSITEEAIAAAQKLFISA